MVKLPILRVMLAPFLVAPKPRQTLFVLNESDLPRRCRQCGRPGIGRAVLCKECCEPKP